MANRPGLTDGIAIALGAAMKAIKDLSGQKFGRLTVLGRGHLQSRWRCECACGNQCIARNDALLSGRTKSCGCFRAEFLKNRVSRHGHKRGGTSPTYRSWAMMKNRCLNKSSDAYSHYGGRGITVCDRWLSFENFLADMGERPSLLYSLDRFPNNNGNYEPGNCRWATRSEQGRNTRNNVNLTIKAETRCVEEWSEISGINSNRIHQRIAMGWPAADAVFLPPGQPRQVKEQP